jgi:hypothetical protein
MLSFRASTTQTPSTTAADSSRISENGEVTKLCFMHIGWWVNRTDPSSPFGRVTESVPDPNNGNIADHPAIISDCFSGFWCLINDSNITAPANMVSFSAPTRHLVVDALEHASVDAKLRGIVWDDGKRVSIKQSVDRIHAGHPNVPQDQIESHVCGWLEGCAPNTYSEHQLESLDHLTGPWLTDDVQVSAR